MLCEELRESVNLTIDAVNGSGYLSTCVIVLFRYHFEAECYECFTFLMFHILLVGSGIK